MLTLHYLLQDTRKATNRNQFERLLTLIERNTDIVGDIHKESSKFWEGVTTELNELGPPSKNATAWKKVCQSIKPINVNYFLNLLHILH